MRAHTITARASTIVSGGLLALSLAAVLLAATASAAGASITSGDRFFLWCAPLPTTPTPLEQIDRGCIEPANRRASGNRGRSGPSFNFGDRRVGTTSPAQGFVLPVPANHTLNPRIRVSGDYTQTNTCPPTLTGPTLGCLITVTFTPSGTGPKRGTLRTGPGGPTLPLTGNGVTTRTPPVLPLTLTAYTRDPQQLGRRGVVSINYVEAAIGHCHVLGCPDYDATLVLGGDVKRTTTQVPATQQAATNDPTEITARLNHLKQLKAQPTAPTIKIKLTATDEFGQTATEELKVELCSRLIGHREDVICRWHPSRKGDPR